MVLFVVIVVGALAANSSVFLDNLPTLGPVLVLLNVVMLGVGVLLGRLGGLDRRQGTAVALEAGVQNATLGIAVATILADGTDLSTFAVPSGVYGITMYLVALPFVFWARRA
jgi:BASS family bile acid:Na+ symporter